MSSYYTRKTADYSPLVVHFTKGTEFMRPDLVTEADPLFNFKQSPAMDRLLSILTMRTIYSSPMPMLPNNPKAVSFTECTWDSLVRLAETYSSYGVVFSKRIVFEQGGGPALYVRGDLLGQLAQPNAIPTQIEPFIEPFDPTAILRPHTPIDFVHEREWRLPSQFTFSYEQLEYVLVDSIEEATSVVHKIGSQRLPESKLIPLKTYEEIRKAWGKE